MFEADKRQAMHLLTSLEDGSMSTADLRMYYEQADPALVHFVFSWLRHRYPPSHSASDGVLGRIVSLCRESPTVARMAREGASDPIVAWFEEAYSYRDLDRTTFISLVVDKLEG